MRTSETPGTCAAYLSGRWPRQSDSGSRPGEARQGGTDGPPQLQIFQEEGGQSQTVRPKPFLKAREGGVVDQSVLGVDQVPEGSAVEEGFPTGGALRTGVLFREIDKLISRAPQISSMKKPP